MLERSVFTIMLGCNQWIIFKRLGQGQSIVPWIFFYFSPVVNRNHTVLGLFFFLAKNDNHFPIDCLDKEFV